MEKPKYYVLPMFPYPSGFAMHVGHVSNFLITEFVAKIKRMQGYDVIFPLGYDSFGLPTENFAIKNNKSAQTATEENIAYYETQIEKVGFTFDKERRLATSDPEYYKRTQRIFSKLFEHGLAYKKDGLVNRCPVDQTVLANDQVVDGKCERCESIIIQKQMPQWYIKITDYCEQLLDYSDCDRPEETKIHQKNWIGRSEGAEIDFEVQLHPNTKIKVFTTRPDTLYGVTAIVLAPENQIIDHLLNSQKKEELKEFRTQVAKLNSIDRQSTERTKNGMNSGIFVTHPLSGEQVPVWFGDYVLPDYATGAVMFVPAHDERDYEFANKYNIEVKHVIAQHYISGNPPVPWKTQTVRSNVLAVLLDEKGENALCLDWKKAVWRSFVMGGVEEWEDWIEAGQREICEETGYTDIEYVETIAWEIHAEYFAPHKDVNRYSYEKCLVYRLKSKANNGIIEDEDNHSLHRIAIDKVEEFLSEVPGDCNSNLIFFQRYKKKNQSYTWTGKLINSGQFDGLDNIEAKAKITTYLESLAKGNRKTTYRLRDWSVSRQRYRWSPIPVYYTFADNEDNTYDAHNPHPDKSKWIPHAIPDDELPVLLPLDLPNYKPAGKSPLEDHPTFKYYHAKDGKTYLRECDTLDTFMCSSFYYLRFLDPKNTQQLISPENAKYMPVDLYVGGKEHTVGHLIYSRFIYKFLQDTWYIQNASKEPFAKLVHQGMVQGPDGRKMSKRRGNIIDPVDIITQYNADTLRTYIAFMGPIDINKNWNPDSVAGVKRFLDRVERATQFIDKGDHLDSLTQITVQGVSQDMEALKFNTAVSKLMILTNEIYDKQSIGKKNFEILLLLLSVFASESAQKLRTQIGNTGNVADQTRPQFDSSKVADQIINLPIQINGKLKGSFPVPKVINQEEVIELVKADEKLNRYLS